MPYELSIYVSSLSYFPPFPPDTDIIVALLLLFVIDVVPPLFPFAPNDVVLLPPNPILKLSFCPGVTVNSPIHICPAPPPPPPFGGWL